MSNEILSRDQNHITVLGGVTDDSNLTITMLRIDPITKRLLVSATGLPGGGTVTSITQGTGILATPNPIIATGTIALATALQPMASLTGNSLKVLRVNAGETAVEYATVSSGGITIGTTTITSGNNTRILYNNSGVVGEYTLTGTGTVVAMATSPTFQTSINGAYLTASQILITDGSSNIISAAVATYPSLTELSYVKGVTSAIQTQINAKGAGTVTAIGVSTANGVSGSSSGGATPNLTVTLGAITPTTVNGNTFTTGSSTYTGTAGQTYTFPSTTASIARTDSTQTFTGVQTFSQIVTTSNAITASGNAATVPITSRISTVTNNSAATLTITMTTASAVDGQMVMVRVLDATGVAQTITWVNTENSTVTAPTTSNGSTTLPLTVGFQYNAGTSKWRCIASA